MAKTLKAGESLGADGTKKEYDAKAREQIINECVAVSLAIKKARADLNEQAGDVRTRLRDAGIQTAAYDFALRLKVMEQEARDNYVGGLEECYDAMGLGGQLSFLKVAEKSGDAAAAGSNTDKGMTYEAGRKAGLDGKPQTENPHLKGKTPHKIWNEGWMAGQSEIAGGMGKANGHSKKPDAEQGAAAVQ